MAAHPYPTALGATVTVSTPDGTVHELRGASAILHGISGLSDAKAAGIMWTIVLCSLIIWFPWEVVKPNECHNIIKQLLNG